VEVIVAEIVPYQRFLEIRLRRKQVVEQLMERPVAATAGGAVEDGPAAGDCEVPSDERSSTRSGEARALMSAPDHRLPR
jgi:hypothetical protein